MHVYVAAGIASFCVVLEAICSVLEAIDDVGFEAALAQNGFGNLAGKPLCPEGATACS
jgi:hypothetical protein